MEHLVGRLRCGQLRMSGAVITLAVLARIGPAQEETVPGRWVTGRVLDEDGRAMEGVEVILEVTSLSFGDRSPWKDRAYGGRSRSAADGSFRLFDFNGEANFVSLRHPSAFPGSRGLELGGCANLSLGDTVLSARQELIVWVTGVPDVDVLLTCSNEESGGNSAWVEAGCATFRDLERGSYRVHLGNWKDPVHGDGVPVVVPQRSVVDLDLGGLDWIEIPLRGGTDLTGREVHVEGFPREMTLRLRGQSLWLPSSSLGRWAKVEVTGYQPVELPPLDRGQGPLFLEEKQAPKVETCPPMVVRVTDEVTGLPLPDAEVVFDLGSHPFEVEWALAPPETSSEAAASREAWNDGAWRSIRANSTGLTRIWCRAPGYCAESKWEWPKKDLEVIEFRLRREVLVDLTFERGPEIGNVTVLVSEPVEAWIETMQHWNDPDYELRSFEQWVEPVEGGVRLHGLPAGNWDLRVIAERGATEFRRLALESEPLEVALDLRPEGRIHGWIPRTDRPIQGVEAVPGHRAFGERLGLVDLVEASSVGGELDGVEFVIRGLSEGEHSLYLVEGEENQWPTMTVCGWCIVHRGEVTEVGEITLPQRRPPLP